MTLQTTIYTTRFCPYCIRAKHLLKKKGIKFKEIGVDGDRKLRAKMTQLANGATSVPQIWIGDRHIGGCDQLMELDYTGQLDELITELG